MMGPVKGNGGGGGGGGGGLWLACEDSRTGPGLRCPLIPQAASAWRVSCDTINRKYNAILLIETKAN